MPVSAIIDKQLESYILYRVDLWPGGTTKYQTCHIQQVRTNEVFQISWLEETGTIVSLVLHIAQKRISTIFAFSKVHWENARDAHGDKRNSQDFERWRGLTKIGIQTERHLIIEQATIDKIYDGRGRMDGIDENALTV